MSYNFGHNNGETFYQYIERVEVEFEHKVKHEGASEALINKIVEIFTDSVFSKYDYMREVNRLLETKIKNPTAKHVYQMAEFIRYRLTKKIKPQLELNRELKYLEQ